MEFQYIGSCPTEPARHTVALPRYPTDSAALARRCSIRPVRRRSRAYRHVVGLHPCPTALTWQKYLVLQMRVRVETGAARIRDFSNRTTSPAWTVEYLADVLAKLRRTVRRPAMSRRRGQADGRSATRDLPALIRVAGSCANRDLPKIEHIHCAILSTHPPAFRSLLAHEHRN